MDSVTRMGANTFDWAMRSLSSVSGSIAPREVERIVVREALPASFKCGRHFLRIAGFSGALALVLGSYGAHGTALYLLIGAVAVALEALEFSAAYDSVDRTPLVVL